jgi:hypothetical protein
MLGRRHRERGAPGAGPRSAPGTASVPAGVLTDSRIVARHLLVAQHVGQVRALIGRERLLDHASPQPATSIASATLVGGR